MMKRIYIVFLGLFVFNISSGQVGQSVYNRWFIDKPTLKQDSLELIKSGFTKINVYELFINDSSGFDKKLLNTWTLKNINGRLRPTPSKPDANVFLKINSQVIKSDKIIENIGGDCEKFQLTHYINKQGQIIKTENKRVDSKCESKYFFDWADYKYENNLLKEITCYSKGHFVTKNLAYAKYVFEYLK